MSQYIYYSGVGAKKNGKHSVKEFLDIMNKNFNVRCSEFKHGLDYKPCSEYKEMNIKALNYNIKHSKAISNKKLTRRFANTSKKYNKLLDQCIEYKNKTKKRKCNLEEYIKFSGALPEP